MITYGHEIPVKEYNSIRESVGWKVLREEQAQKGLDRSEFLIAAYDGEKAVASARVVGDEMCIRDSIYALRNEMRRDDLHGEDERDRG